MKFTLKPNAELDLITQDELRTVMAEIVSGFARPPQRIRSPAGVSLDGAGAGTVAAYTVEAGMEFVLTRIEFSLDGYNMRAPFAVVSGGVDVYVDSQWRVGVPFGAGSGSIGSLPAVYVEAEGRAVVCSDGAQITISVAGGKALTGLLVTTCGFLTPQVPVI